MAGPAPLYADRGDGRADTAANRCRSGKTSTPGGLTNDRLKRRPNLHPVDGRSLGDGLRFQTDKRRATEVAIAADVLNRMLELGRPEYVRIA